MAKTLQKEQMSKQEEEKAGPVHLRFVRNEIFRGTGYQQTDRFLCKKHPKFCLIFRLSFSLGSMRLWRPHTLHPAPKW